MNTDHDPKLAPFEQFVPLVIETVGPVLHHAGLVGPRPDVHSVAWEKGRVATCFSYWPEDRPRFVVLVGLRVQQSDGVLEVGLWRVLDDLGISVDPSTWRFTDEHELRRALRSIIDRVLDPHGERIWTDEQRLITLHAHQAAEAETHRHELIRQSALARARRSFDADDFGSAVSEYVLLGTDDLTAADRRRLHVARTRLAKDGIDDGRSRDA